MTCLRRLRLSLLCLLLLATPAVGQTVVGPTTVDFQLASQGVPVNTPPTAYQAILLSATVDPVSGSTLQVGPVVPASAVVASPAAGYQRLTLTSLGVTVPPCTVVQASCPTYVLTLLTVANGLTAPRSVASTSNPFSAATSFSPPPPPAPAVNVKVS